MATNWTNPVSPGSRILASDVQEVINAIDANRSCDGQAPASGTAVWLLSSLDLEFDRHVAVRETQRPWYQTFKLWQP